MNYACGCSIFTRRSRWNIFVPYISQGGPVAVYVDHAKNPYRGMLMCHMLADTVEELHAMAEKIGMKREWFQCHGAPHYDICQEKRALAVKAGAIQMNRRQTGELSRRLRAEFHGSPKKPSLK